MTNHIGIKLCYNPGMSECLDSLLVGNTSFEVCVGNLVEEQVDAIVNAANSHLQHGGGVAGAIVRQGGAIIQTESDDWIRRHQRVSHTNPALTSAGKLPSKYVIHAVGPIWGEGDEDRKLMEAVRGALELADSMKLQSISIPAISTGIYGFPKERAARIILRTIYDWLKKTPSTSLERIRMVLLSTDIFQIFHAEFEKLA
jgi:O-acetyl-ADP-ribose deacetylase (regulator of RNase III)